MRNRLQLAGFFAFLVLLPGAKAADLSGNWKGAFDFNDRSVPVTFHLIVTGETVTGTVEGLPTTPAEIHDGKLDGAAVSFWINTSYQGETYKLLCKGTPSPAGDTIAFSMGTEDGSWSTQLTATHGTDAAAAPLIPDVTGNWKGSFVLHGDTMPLTFHLSSANGQMTGTIEGLPTSPAEIHDGTIDEDTVTFWVSTGYQGQTYKLQYKGKISAGQIAFTFGLEDGSWNSELTATKSM